MMCSGRGLEGASHRAIVSGVSGVGDPRGLAAARGGWGGVVRCEDAVLPGPRRHAGSQVTTGTAA